MYALEAKHLFKSYRTRGKKVEVLQDISLKICRGEMVAVMGASGSGKTTLLHNLSGIDVPDSGENILLPMILDKRKEMEQAQQLRKMLELTGIGELADRGITELSGGQQQRVANARAFIQEPDFIFADEPTGNLDAETTENILHCMTDMNRNTGVSMLIVTHDMHVASVCHRILRLEDGGVAYDVF